MEQEIPLDNKTNQQTNEKQNWESKTDERGGVTTTITPIYIFSPSSEWKFDIEMNTHSVELKDPMSSTILVDDKGKEYKAIRRWLEIKKLREDVIQKITSNNYVRQKCPINT